MLLIICVKKTAIKSDFKITQIFVTAIFPKKKPHFLKSTVNVCFCLGQFR